LSPLNLTRPGKNLKGGEEYSGEEESCSCVIFISKYVLGLTCFKNYPVATIFEIKTNLHLNLAKQSMHLFYYEASSVSKEAS
jgi:hypothetical protein